MDARGGYDSYHNLATGEGFAQFRDLAVEQGFSLLPEVSFTAVDLEAVDALVLLQPYALADAYTPEEVEAIQLFAARGGRLVVLADGGTGSSAAYLNDLSLSFGISYSETTADALGATLTDFVVQKLTVGVEGIRVDYQRPITASPPGEALAWSGALTDACLAVSGNAVFLSDSSVFMNPDGYSDASIADASNAVLARNVVRYLAAVPEIAAVLPVSLALLGFTGCRLVRRCLR
ncbi:MAG: hypothetical protein H7A46_24765 [Verrucomicrobiales bacterium]|nr:hypothetical protein [Verrucomicrobiales bacterium]